eukprot:2969605-Rhodomonas_salina.5
MAVYLVDPEVFSEDGNSGLWWGCGPYSPWEDVGLDELVAPYVKSAPISVGDLRASGTEFAPHMNIATTDD